jgi:hypothetical protein
MGLENMRRLPDHAVTFEYVNEHTLVVGAHEVNGYRFYTGIRLSDLPQNCASLEELEGAALARIDVLACIQGEAFHTSDFDKLPIDGAPEGDPLPLDNRV